MSQHSGFAPVSVCQTTKSIRPLSAREAGARRSSKQEWQTTMTRTWPTGPTNNELTNDKKNLEHVAQPRWPWVRAQDLLEGWTKRAHLAGDDPTYNELARTTNINQQPQNLKHITAARACASRSSVLKSSDLSSDLGSDLRSDLRSDLSSDLSFEHARAAIARPSSKREWQTTSTTNNKNLKPRACPSCPSVLEQSDPSSDLGSDLGSDLRSDLRSDLS